MPRRAALRQHLCSALLALGLASCASNKYFSSDGHGLMATARYDEAAAVFSKNAEKPSANQVLFLLDQGTALFRAGRYPEAIQVFLKAEKLCEIKDYTSLSEEVGVLATSSNVRGYKGEDFEKVLINVYLSLAFAAQGDIEGAQVEARKINLLLYRMIHEGKRNYQESPFARFLSALLWEASGDYNAAFVDYKFVYDLDKNFPLLPQSLLGALKKIRFNDEFRDWSLRYPEASPFSLNRDEGELVIFFERGRAPKKEPRWGEDESLPRYVSRATEATSFRVKQSGQVLANAYLGLDIESLSIRYLEDRISRMKGAKLLGAAFKGAVAYGVGKALKSEDAGWITFFALLATDQADLRSWQSLPAAIDFARVPLKAGIHNVEVEVMSGEGVLRTISLGELVMRPGKKVFKVVR